MTSVGTTHTRLKKREAVGAADAGAGPRVSDSDGEGCSDEEDDDNDAEDNGGTNERA